MRIKNKVLTSSIVMLMAIGLAGCTNSAAAPTTNKSQAVNAKVTKKVASNHNTQKQVSSNNSSNISSTSNSSINQTNSFQNTATSSSATSSVVTPRADSTGSSDKQNQQVLASFVNQSNVQKDGNQYLVTPQSQDKYQIEVRNNQGGDPNVAHLTGTYQYDPTTQQIQTMNPVTGEFE